MDKVEKEVKASDIDYEIELESMREETWQEYKKDFSKELRTL